LRAIDLSTIARVRQVPEGVLAAEFAEANLNPLSEKAEVQVTEDFEMEPPRGDLDELDAIITSEHVPVDPLDEEDQEDDPQTATEEDTELNDSSPPVPES
jgi:hypothetical protein